ncbi:hypothetical protein TSAR_010227, partial [Trichomalopsis sarcophagae]
TLKAMECTTSIASLSTACTWTVIITDLNIFVPRSTVRTDSVIGNPRYAWHLWPILTRGYKNLQRAIYIDRYRSVIEDSSLSTQISNVTGYRETIFAYMYKKSRNPLRGSRNQLPRILRKFVQRQCGSRSKTTVKPSRQCKHIYSAQLIDICGKKSVGMRYLTVLLIEICEKAIPNCITYNSLCYQLYGPTTFRLECQLRCPTSLEKKVEILFWAFFLCPVIRDPEYSESLGSDSTAGVQKHNFKFQADNKYVGKRYPTVFLIEICEKAIHNFITHNSLCSQLHSLTTFRLERQLHGPTTLEEKVEILF